MSMDAESYLKTGSNELRILEYQVANMAFGINILKVAKIVNNLAKFTRMPDSHPAIGGVFQDMDRVVPVVDLSKIGHKREEGRYFVLMRANGSSMYGCRDLSYTIHKITQNADNNLIVLGEDHKLYAEQVSLILKAAGYKAPSMSNPARSGGPVGKSRFWIRCAMRNSSDVA